MLDRHDENTIHGYIEGELSSDERAAFESVMAQDESLRLLVTELLRDREMLRAVPAEEAPPHLMMRVAEALERHMPVSAPGEASPRTFKFPLWARWAGAMAAMLLITAGLFWQYDPFGWSRPGDIEVVIVTPPDPRVIPVVPDPVVPVGPVVAGPGGDGDKGGTSGAEMFHAPGGKGTIALALAEQAFLRKSLDRKALEAMDAAKGSMEEKFAEGGRGGGAGRAQAAVVPVDELAVQIELQTASPAATRDLLMAWADGNDADDFQRQTYRGEARRLAFSNADAKKAGFRDNAELEKAITGDSNPESKQTEDNGGGEGHPVPSPARGNPAPAKPDAAKDQAKPGAIPAPPLAADPAPTRGGKNDPGRGTPEKTPPTSPVLPAPVPGAPVEKHANKETLKDAAAPPAPAPPHPAPPASPRPDAIAKGSAPAIAKTDAAAPATTADEAGSTERLAGDADFDANIDRKSDGVKPRAIARQEIEILVPADKLDSLVQHIEKRTGQSLVVVQDGDGAYLLSPQIANQRTVALAEKAKSDADAREYAERADAGPGDRARAARKDEAKKTETQANTASDPKSLGDAAGTRPNVTPDPAPGVDVVPTPAAPVTPTAPAPTPDPAPGAAAKTEPPATPDQPRSIEPAAPGKPGVVAAAPPPTSAKQQAQPRRVLVRIVIVEDEKK